MSLRPGVSNDRVDFLNQVREDARPIEEQVAETCPEPNPVIVERLRKRASQLDQSFRLPWQLQPTPPPVDMNEIMFYARILTMLWKLGVQPPVQVDMAGKGFLPGGYRVVPTVVPSEEKGYLRTPNTPEEIEMNALSNEPGSLYQASENMLPEVKTRGRPQVLSLLRKFNRFFRNESKRNPENQAPPNFVITDVNLDDIEFDDLVERELAEFEPTAFADRLDAEVTANNPVLRRRLTERRREAREKISRIVADVQRRLVWARLSPEQKAKIRKVLSREEKTQGGIELPNYYTQTDDPLLDDEPDEGPQFGLPTRRDPTRSRWWLITKIAYYLLVPTGALIAGISVYYQAESTSEEDKLVQLFRAMPETHWFRQLPIRSWIKLVGLTNRQENYLLLQQVNSTKLQFFKEDVYVLWNIDKKLFDTESQNLPLALAWFDVIKNAVNYRSKHQQELKDALELKLPLSPFDFCYVCQASDPNGLSVISNFAARNALVTQELAEKIEQTKLDIETERMSPNRSNNYQELINAFQKAMPRDQFLSDWAKAMINLSVKCQFRFVIHEDAFSNFLSELETNTSLYPSEAKSTVSEFLHRFQAQRDGLQNVIPFKPYEYPLLYDEDKSLATQHMLRAMNKYANDGDKDQLCYDYFNENWDKRSSHVVFENFDDVIAPFELNNKSKFLLFVLLGAIQQGVVTYMSNIQNELFDSGDELPEKLKSVNLSKQAQTDVELPPEDRHRLASHNRQVLFAAGNEHSYATAPFYRTRRYILFPIGLVSFFMVTVEGNKEFANIVTINNPSNLLPNTQQEDTENEVPAEFNIQIYKKEIKGQGPWTTFQDDTWSGASLKAGVYAGMVWAATVLRPNGGAAKIVSFLASTATLAGPTIINAGNYAINYGANLFAQAKSLTFNKAAFIATSAGVVAYGPKATADAISQVGKGVQSAGVGILLAGITFGVLYMLPKGNIFRHTKGTKRKSLLN